MLRRDRWATMWMSLDKYGNQTGCRVLASNLRRTEDRWRVCNQMRQYWTTREATRDEVTLPGTVRRTLVVRSMKSRSSKGAGFKRIHIY